MKRLRHHGRNIELISIKSPNGIEHFRGHDILVFGLEVLVSPEFELSVRGVAEDLRVSCLPEFQLLPFGLSFCVDFEKGQEFLEQSVTGKLERGNRTFESLEEVRSNQTNNLFLSILLEGINRLVWSLIPSQWVIHREREQRAVSGKGVFEDVEQAAVRLSD